jgi:hypothetical protein
VLVETFIEPANAEFFGVCRPKNITQIDTSKRFPPQIV